MAFPLANTFEGIPDETTLTAKAIGNTAASGDPLDIITIGATGEVKADTAHAAHGTVGVRISIGATSTTCFYGWTASLGASLTTLYGRVYLYMTAIPATSLGIIKLASAAGQVARIQVRHTEGALEVRDASNTIVGIGAVPITFNAWVRIEFRCVVSAVLGQVDTILYNSADSSTPTESVLSGNVNTGASPIDELRIGVTGNTANVSAFWTDTPKIDTAGFVGSANVSTQGAASVTGHGTIAATGKRIVAGSSAIHGGGTIAATGKHLGVGAAAIAGAGTISATSATSDLDAGVWNSSVVTWNDPNYTWDGELISGSTFVGAANVTGHGTISATGKRVRIGAANITGHGSVAVSSTKRTVLGEAAITGHGSIIASTTGIRFGAAAITGHGSIAATGARTVLGEAAIVGTGEILASPRGVIYGFAAIVGQGGLVADGVVIELTTVITGEAAIVGHGTIGVSAVSAGRSPNPVPGRVTVLMGGGMTPTPSSW